MRVHPRRATFAVLTTLIAILAVGPAASPAQAQVHPKKKDTSARLKPKEVSYTTKVEPARAKPGDTVTYTVTLKVDAPWHIYGYVKQQPAANGPRGTQFDFFDRAGLTLSGDWNPSEPPKVKLDEQFDNLKVEYHEGRVSWSVKLKIPADAKPGKKTLRNQIYYQICDPKSCKPPTYVTLPDATVTVVNDGSALAPRNHNAWLTSLVVGTVGPPVAKPKNQDSKAERRSKDISFSTAVSPGKAKPGETVTYSVTAKLEPSWHINAQAAKQPADAPTATRFDFFDTAGMSVVGSWSPSAPPRLKNDPNFKEPVLFHEDEVSWSIKLKVSEDATPGKKTLRNQIFFQICDENECMFPVYWTVPDATLTIVTDGSASLPDNLSTDVAMLVVATTPGAGSAPNGELGTAINGGLLSFLLYSALGGLFAVLMPCVWPMIPITVNFFVKQGESKSGSPTKLAFAYCLAIIGIFTAIGLAVTAALGAPGASQLGNNKWVNLLFGVAFIGLGLSLLGLFEVRLPSFLLNASAQNEGKGGLIGVMFMATTLTITSFTCTAPVVGTLLILATKGQFFYPVLGLLTFSSVLALPFFLLALMPGLMRRMPRSGDWMNAIKVVGGMVEIALAFKFLNTAEIGFGASSSSAWIDAQVVLTVWVATSIACGIYLLGLFRTNHDHEPIQVGPIRMIAGVGFLAAGLFLAPALFGNPPHSRIYSEIVGILPPDSGELDTREDTIRRTVTEVAELVRSNSGQPSRGAKGELETAEAVIRGPVHATSTDPDVAILQEKKFHGVAWGLSYDAAVAEAKAKKKLLFIDFTGLNCTNCRKVENGIMPRPEVVAELKKFVTVSLYTDFVDIGSISPDQREELAIKNQEREVEMAGSNSSPVYVIATPEGKVLGQTEYNADPGFLLKFIRETQAKIPAGEKVAQTGGM
ncbi:MAG: dsbD 2 [Planctomycetota bacterium]|nr:dsbD 2 [Planctomycetota bacterium]